MIGTGDIMLRNLGAVANILSRDPAEAAAAWTALARGIWVLLLNLALLRTKGHTRAPGYLGVFLGVAGILTLIPVLTEVMFIIFGPGMMVWTVWMGIIMLRDKTTPRG
jgi:hypothetical protein